MSAQTQAQTERTRRFLLPDLGEGLTEAEIVSWLVRPGDVIAIDQAVVEVESAKSIVELPSPYGGRVEALHAAVGDVVHKDEPLITVVATDADPVDASGGGDPMDAGSGALGAETPATDGRDVVPGTAVRGLPTPNGGAGAGADSGTGADSAAEAAAPAENVSGAVLVGYGVFESTTRLARPAGGRFGGRGEARGEVVVAQAPAAEAATASPTRSGLTSPSSSMRIDPSRRSPVVSPIVRRLARDHGFDASQLLGTGRGGLVVRGDVETAIAERGATSPSAAGSAADVDDAATATGAARAAAAPTASGEPTASAAGSQGVASAAPTDGDVRIPLTGLRRVVAQRLSHSRRTIPEATVWLDVDATGLLDAKRRIQQATGERVSVTALIARIAVAGLAKFPILNSSVTEDETAIVQHARVNLGLAAQTPRGLMVPVVHGVDGLSLVELRDRIEAVVGRSSTGSFPPAALSGGTFTLNNYGRFGVDGSTPIINHPEAAMLGVGRMIDRPWVVDGELAVRKVVQLTLVFDHRVCDGDVASGFLTFVARSMEEPLGLLLGL